jgi:hypothetical protein
MVATPYKQIARRGSLAELPGTRSSGVEELSDNQVWFSFGDYIELSYINTSIWEPFTVEQIFQGIEFFIHSLADCKREYGDA